MNSNEDQVIKQQTVNPVGIAIVENGSNEIHMVNYILY